MTEANGRVGRSAKGAAARRIMGEIGEATRSERVTVKIEAPDLSGPVRKKRKPAFERNVIPLRKTEGA